MRSVALGLQVYKEYLLRALKYLDMTYFGRFGASALGYCPGHTRFPLKGSFKGDTDIAIDIDVDIDIDLDDRGT